MKKLIILLLISLHGIVAIGQTVNAPQIPTVNIQRLRTDTVFFSVRFQQDGVNMNISASDFRLELVESGTLVRLTLSDTNGISRPDTATLTVSLTVQQVANLTRQSYQYRLYTVSSGARVTKLMGGFLLANTVSSTASSVVPPVIAINYTSTGPTVVGGYVPITIAHTHSISDVTGLTDSLSAIREDIGSGGGGGTWGSITGTLADQVDLKNALDLKLPTSYVPTWTAVTGKPSFATVATSGSYSDLSGTPTLGTAAALNVASSGDAASGEVVKGSDTRLSDARTPTAHTHPQSDVTGLQTALDAKQATLVSGTNIKTINSASILGSGNITAGDAVLSATQTFTGLNTFNGNPVIIGSLTNTGETGLQVTGTSKLTGNMTIVGDILPEANLTRNLGSNTLRFNAGHFSFLQFGATNETVSSTRIRTQTGVYIGGAGSGANASAVLDVVSTGNNKGALLPRMTTAQFLAIPSKAVGLEAYSTDDAGKLWYDGTRVTGFRFNGTKFQGYDGTTWVDLN